MGDLAVPPDSAAVLLNSPADTPTQRAEHPDEQSARAELERLYAEGRAYGQWKIRRPGEDHLGTATRRVQATFDRLARDRLG